jgi:hypothetical protein
MLQRHLSVKKQQSDDKELADFNHRTTEHTTAANMSEQERVAILNRGMFPFSSAQESSPSRIDLEPLTNVEIDERYARALNALRATLRTLGDKESAKNVPLTLQTLDSFHLTHIVSSDCKKLIEIIKNQKENSPEDTVLCTRILSETNNLIKKDGASATQINSYLNLTNQIKNKSTAWDTAARVMGVLAGLTLIALGFAALIGTMGGAGALSVLSVYIGVKIAAAFLAPAIGTISGLTLIGAATNHKANWEKSSEYMSCMTNHLQKKPHTPLFYKPVATAIQAASTDVKSVPAKPALKTK